MLAMPSFQKRQAAKLIQILSAWQCWMSWLVAASHWTRSSSFRIRQKPGRKMMMVIRGEAALIAMRCVSWMQAEGFFGRGSLVLGPGLLDFRLRFEQVQASGSLQVELQFRWGTALSLYITFFRFFFTSSASWPVNTFSISASTNPALTALVRLWSCWPFGVQYAK